MNRNNILPVLILLMCGMFVFTSCGSDDDDELKPNKENNNDSGNKNDNGNGGSTDANGWKTDASSLKTATSYYVGTWYDNEQLAVFLAYKKQGYAQGMKESLHNGLEFYQNGTGAEIWYNGSSSKKEATTFTWKVIKTKRPQLEEDYLLVKYQYDSYAENIILHNGSVFSMSYADRYMGAGLIDYGYGEYDDWNFWQHYVRYTGSSLSW